MLRTDYRPARTQRAIVRTKHIDGSMPFKLGLCVMVVLIHLIGFIVTKPILPDVVSFFASILFGMVAWGVMKAIFVGFPVEAVFASKVHKNLEDEAEGLVSAFRAVKGAQALHPEGVAITERTYEFGRLSFLEMKKMEEMNSVEVGRSTNTTKHKFISDMQTDAKNLAKTGWDLADLIASNRAEAIYGDTKYIGIAEYMDEVNLETMAHKALGSGEPEATDEFTAKVDRYNKVRKGCLKAQKYGTICNACLEGERCVY